MAPKSKSPSQPVFRVTIAGSVFDYPLIESDNFKQGDIRLICAATGMEWEAWLTLLKRSGLNNALTRQGFFAVAVQRARDFEADQVVAFIDELPLIAGFELVFPDAPKVEGEQSGPPEGEGTEG